MDKFTKLYNDVIDLLYHCKEQGFIKETEAEYIIGEVDKIKEEIESQ